MFKVRRFSLSALLMVFTIVSVGLGVVGYHRYAVTRQTAALVQIEALGGIPTRVEYRNGMALNVASAQALKFTWLNNLFGEDYYVYVPLIDISDPVVTADSIRSMIPFIKQLRMTEGLNEAGKTNIALRIGGNPNVDTALLQELRDKLPNCLLLSPQGSTNGPYQTH